MCVLTLPDNILQNGQTTTFTYYGVETFELNVIKSQMTVPDAGFPACPVAAVQLDPGTYASENIEYVQTDATETFDILRITLDATTL